MRKLTLSLAILAAMMPGRGYPLGLGEIELNSALNQDLDAEIEVLSAQPEDAEQEKLLHERVLIVLISCNSSNLKLLPKAISPS